MVGAINVDLVIRAERLPGPGETVVGPRVDEFGGGKGANAAVAAARAGAEVSLVGAVGIDTRGRDALATLRADGVAVDHVALLDSPTGTAFIVVDHQGENQIAVGLGANGDVAADDVAGAVGALAHGAGCVLVSTEIPGGAAAAAVRAAHDAGVPCVLNPAPVKPELLDVLELGPLLTPNQGELADVAVLLGAEATDLEGMAAAVHAVTNAAVVVTLGGDGVLVVDTSGTRLVPSLAVEVVDTTGAGDTFNGVLAAQLAAGAELDLAVRTAVAAAALSVTRLGAREGMPTATEIAAALTR